MVVGTVGVNQGQLPLRVMGYQVDSVKYLNAASLYDLSAEQTAQVYKLRWDIEKYLLCGKGE